MMSAKSSDQVTAGLVAEAVTRKPRKGDILFAMAEDGSLIGLTVTRGARGDNPWCFAKRTNWSDSVEERVQLIYQ